MSKIVSVLLVAGLAGATLVESARACGGGGCGGGRGITRSAGGRTVAARMATGGGANLARHDAQPGRRAGARAVVQTVAVNAQAAPKAAAKTPIYTCPMHPQVQWTKPTDCPICGMKLTLKRAKAGATDRAPAASGDHAAMAMDDHVDGGSMADMPGMDDGQIGGMGGMMMCPGCTRMGGMSGMGGGSKASGKVNAGQHTGGMGGMCRCGGC